MRTRVSRLWVKRYWQPRSQDGRFLRDYLLWTREWHHDKDARWIWYPQHRYEGWPGPT